MRILLSLCLPLCLLVARRKNRHNVLSGSLD